MALYTVAGRSQGAPTTERPHFATLLVMALAPEEVGDRIAAARKQRGWTHEQFALQAGVGLRTVQRWQKGRNPKDGKSWLPRLGTLMELADLLGVSRSYFVEDEISEKEPEWLAPLRGELEAEVARLRGLNDALEAELKPARPGRTRRAK